MEKKSDDIKIPETISCTRNTFSNYKIKLPKVCGKTESLLNVDKNHFYVGGDVWICLWFRDGKMGNQISLEYNRFSNNDIYNSDSNGGSIGKHFVESYFPIELTPFIIKSLKVFQKIIGKKENDYITTLNEFRGIVEKEFLKDGGKEEDDKQNTLV